MRSKLEYEFFINVLRKDMELTLWKMQVANLFGDFDIFSEEVNEMDSFDHIVEFYFQEKADFETKNLASDIISACFEHFYAFVYHRGKNRTQIHHRALPEIFLGFIQEAVHLRELNYEEAAIQLRELERVHFKFEESMTDYLKSEYLN